MLKKIKNLLFHNITTRQTIAKNTFWLAVSNVGGRLLRAAVVIYAARTLGAENWGIFSYALSLVALFTIFADLGIGQIIVRDIAEAKDRPDYRRKLLSTSFFVKAAMMAVGVAAVLFVAPLFPIGERAKAVLPIVIFVFVFDVFRQFGFSLVHALEKMEWEAGLYLLTNAAIVAFGFAFLAVQPTARSFAFAYALGTGVGAAATMLALKKQWSGMLSNFSWRIAKYVFSVGWPFAVSAILVSLLVNTDAVIIGWLRSAAEVGLYSAADRTIQLLYVFPTIFSASILPALSRMAKRGADLGRAASIGISTSYLVAAPLVAGGIILGKGVIGLIFGANYAAAAPAFQVLLVTLLITFPSSILISLIFINNKQKTLAIYAAIAGIMNIVLDFLLIPKFGIVGSSFVTVAAQLSATIYLWRIAKKAVSFSVLPHLKKILAATAIMSVALVLFGQRLNVIAAVLVGAVVYFATLAVLREKLLEEIKLAVNPIVQRP